MAQIHIPKEIPIRYLPRSKGATAFFVILVLLGGLAFAGTWMRDPDQAWRAYVVNWLFFTSVACGAMVLVTATTIVKARWNWSVRRVGLAFSAFLPISFILLLPMLGLGEDYFPWIEAMAHDPIVQKKAAYLNMPFLITRNLVGLALLFGGFLYMAYLYVRPDLGLVKDGGGPGAGGGRGSWVERLTQGWQGQEKEEVRSYQTLKKMAPALVLLYAVVMSVVSFDWAMSLEPHWFSTIFGAWFFMGALWGGVAATAWATVYAKGRDPDLNKLMGVQQLHDLGKLAFAFTVFWAYLFFSQYLVIWYGKLPWEQAWIIHRAEAPWSYLTVLAILLCFVVPFAGLIGRRAKMTPWTLRLFATVILIGLWLERYLMVVPSIHDGYPTITLLEPAIGLLFLGLFLGSVRWFMSTFPTVQIWQPMVEPESLEAEVRDAEGAAV
ncbi:MAG: hypothetical protein HKO65_00965 [Gemmatimonadetes bacterium]|nr:hypothetical protein [Gemmatimonadota bacterium]